MRSALDQIRALSANLTQAQERACLIFGFCRAQAQGQELAPPSELEVALARAAHVVQSALAFDARQPHAESLSSRNAALDSATSRLC